MLMTRPFRLACEKVFLNASVQEGGSTTVEVRSGLDTEPTSSTVGLMKAYNKESATPIRVVDAIKVTVTFANADLKPLQGQMIRLLIHLEKATVCGLSFE